MRPSAYTVATAILAAIALLLGLSILIRSRRSRVVDTGEHTEAVAALRSSEEKFRAVLEGSAAAVFVIDDAQVRYANEAATALTGPPPRISSSAPSSTASTPSRTTSCAIASCGPPLRPSPGCATRPAWPATGTAGSS